MAVLWSIVLQQWPPVQWHWFGCQMCQLKQSPQGPQMQTGRVESKPYWISQLHPHPRVVVAERRVYNNWVCVTLLLLWDGISFWGEINHIMIIHCIPLQIVFSVNTNGNNQVYLKTWKYNIVYIICLHGLLTLPLPHPSSTPLQYTPCSTAFPLAYPPSPHMYWRKCILSHPIEIASQQGCFDLSMRCQTDFRVVYLSNLHFNVDVFKAPY